MELKRILQEMGETLVADFGFKPSTLHGGGPLDQTTAPIVVFLKWLEATPEAKEVLARMGYAPPQSLNNKQPFKIAQ